MLFSEEPLRICVSVASERQNLLAARGAETYAEKNREHHHAMSSLAIAETPTYYAAKYRFYLSATRRRLSDTSLTYSYRSATIGSTLVALRAGM